MAKYVKQIQIKEESLPLLKSWAKRNNVTITEGIIGQWQDKASSFTTSTSSNFRYDTSRKTNNDDLYDFWKSYGIVQNRINIMNSLILGNGISYVYPDSNTQAIIDRFWRLNRIESRLPQICTDIQLYGEAWLGLYGQKSGDILMECYEGRQIDIDANPQMPSFANAYVLSYKDEEKQSDEQITFQPIETVLNEYEFSNAVVNGAVKNARKATGKGLNSKIKNVMAHVKVNCCSSEAYGTSDFYQASDLIKDYYGFVGDRLTIHQLYGSPIYDVTIETDNPEDIQARISELEGFTIGSNPVHNDKETWKLLNSNGGGASSAGQSAMDDNHMLQSLIASSLSIPVSFLFQKTDVTGDKDNTYTMVHLAKDRQRIFRDLFTDIHKIVVMASGGDPTLIDEGEIIMPEIDTSSQKELAETYALRVQSNLTSHQTACEALGLNWEREKERIMQEHEELKEILAPDMVLGQQKLEGAVNGEQGQTRSNGGKSDTTERDKNQRSDPTNVSKTSRPMSQNSGSTTKVTN